VGFLDAVLGRRKPARPNLDALFGLPNAAITLQVSLDMLPTGRGAVAFRAPEGRAFADVVDEVRRLLDADGGPPVEAVNDEYGFTWLVVGSDPPDVPTVVTDVHAVNTSLVEAGFGPQLLCSLVSFRDVDGRPLSLVYLYKRGTFYPFAPAAGSHQDSAGQQRDNVLELRVRDLLAGELRMESDLSRWFAVWGAPGQ
jgi:hypothetical protein